MRKNDWRKKHTFTLKMTVTTSCRCILLVKYNIRARHILFHVSCNPGKSKKKTFQNVNAKFTCWRKALYSTTSCFCSSINQVSCLGNMLPLATSTTSFAATVPYMFTQNKLSSFVSFRQPANLNRIVFFYYISLLWVSE